ncbi:hypothetical protein FQR65_LT05833 [Abscondita terminalis]|nr:hypothetical protein FQR65_LT05833 [Abscondita terminalis]
MGDMPHGEQAEQEKRKRMSCGLEVDCPGDIQQCLQQASIDGFHFVVTHTVHPRFARNLSNRKAPHLISRTDRLLSSTDWNRLIVGKITSEVDVDSEVSHVANKSKAVLNQELGFAAHLGLPATMIKLNRRKNPNLASVLYNKMCCGASQIWINLPMVHPSRYSPICEEGESEDMWEWWNDLRTYCFYDKRLGLALDLPELKHLPSPKEIDRWIGEPVKVLVIHTSLFIINQHQQFVLAKAHQDVIQKFMNLDVQYVIRGPSLSGNVYNKYWAYLNFLGKKLFQSDATTEYIQGCEDYLQNPLQPLTENLESMIYEVFEKDQVKYIEYQKAIQKALDDLPSSIEIPVVMVVGAGRGPLVQAALNASYMLQKKIKLYAVEKNPYAINTLEDRVLNEWNGQVILVKEDMRYFQPEEQADILVSELLGSFGDNELSPECLDGAQRFLKKNGISIPSSYTSFLAPLQSTKIYNEIRNNRPHDKTIKNIYETPYIVHLVNYYQIAPSQEIYKFTHPNWSDVIDNDRFGKLRFTASQNCLLTGFIGYFETVLYKNVMLSINPQTYSEGMVSWFPIVFSLMEPVYVKEGQIIELCFWRMHSDDKVWYQWCLESPIRTSIINPNGRSSFIKMH